MANDSSPNQHQLFCYLCFDLVEAARIQNCLPQSNKDVLLMINKVWASSITVNESPVDNSSVRCVRCELLVKLLINFVRNLHVIASEANKIVDNAMIFDLNEYSDSLQNEHVNSTTVTFRKLFKLKEKIVEFKIRLEDIVGNAMVPNIDRQEGGLSKVTPEEKASRTQILEAWQARRNSEIKVKQEPVSPPLASQPITGERQASTMEQDVPSLQLPATEGNGQLGRLRPPTRRLNENGTPHV